ncbi:uncharacterized protein LOC116342906 [Contarinia nasturtii]|uniref:uncharacterized protein LOC116342906 n=1 Tax=Contarinia nasturtii TaxID=265458 RepID=UPI0012D434FD|nr:uncharacterized protein LOC116342906 [Contarinia nasturtii]
MSFENKVILITGASNGIGAAAAEYFAKHGALLALVGQDGQRFKKVVKKIIACGVTSEPLVILGDVTIDAERIINETIEKYGRLDILINNAGIGIHGTIENVKMEDFDTVMTINARSIVALTQLAVPYLIESKGNVVNVSSAMTLKTFTNSMVFSMSKAALDQFTKCAALHLAEKGVRVNSINLSFIDTDFYTRGGLEKNCDEYADLVERNIKAHPLDRIGYTKDCVNAIAFLAKDRSNFITATLLPVDGGISLKGDF